MNEPKIQHTQIMRAERTAYVYGGESCEEHEPRWDIYAEGDRDNVVDKSPIILKCELFPPGTIVTVEVPVCPECGLDAELCRSNEDCDFDWKQWAEDRYS